MKNNPELPDMPDGTDEPTPTTDIQDTPPWMTRDYLPLTVSPPTHITYYPTQPHPPHPLIGIEFEPQLTLLNYPNKKVVIACNNSHEIEVTTKFNPLYHTYIQDFQNSIVLLLPYNYNNHIDSGSSNLEFRTEPVSFTELPEELNRINATFQSLMLEIAKVTGPLAAFLPAYPCSKHVNLSTPRGSGYSMYDYYNNHKPGIYGNRAHINVPYNFINYVSLLLIMDTYTTKLNTPICLGYTYTGDNWMELNRLS